MPDEADLMRFTFCISGTQKSGTSSLSALLDAHPRVRRAPRKEMHFFDDESRDWAAEDFAEYAVPRRRGRTALGDATPLYLWWPQALERIHRYDPEMRHVVVFRDPIERLFSQWLMVVNRWPAHAPTWDGFLTRFAPDGLEDQIPRDTHVGAYRMHSGVVRGYYGAQLERGHALFGADRIHVLEFRALLEDHPAHLDAITDFLDLPRFEQHPELPHSMPGRPAQADTWPHARDVEALVERYRDDFAVFKRLSGLDVAHWPMQRLLDGELEPAELADKLAAKVVSPPASVPAAGPAAR